MQRPADAGVRCVVLSLYLKATLNNSILVLFSESKLEPGSNLLSPNQSLA
jgi:hypothetical protein